MLYVKPSREKEHRTRVNAGERSTPPFAESHRSYTPGTRLLITDAVTRSAYEHCEHCVHGLPRSEL